jgi:hypothetical protein
MQEKNIVYVALKIKIPYTNAIFVSKEAILN